MDSPDIVNAEVPDKTEKTTALATTHDVDLTPPVTAPVLSREESHAQIGSNRIKTSNKERKILRAAATDDMVSIRPDGACYVPAKFYRQRMTQAFPEVGEWGLKPLGEIKEIQSVLYREYALVVRGYVIDQVMGEQAYHASNSDMTYGDAAEGIRSNALTRLCKNLGVFQEAWDPMWTKRWVQEHAVQVFRAHARVPQGKKKAKPQWRNIEDPPFYDETEPTKDSPNRQRWYDQQAGGSGRQAAPRQTTHPEDTPQKPAQGPDKEMVTSVRKFTRNGKDFIGIKTTVGEYFTYADEPGLAMAQLATEAKDADPPGALEFRSETAKIGNRQIPGWLTEVVK